MKLPTPPRYQYLSFWLSMPFITLAWCYILYGDRIWEDYRPWLIAYPVIYGLGYISWRLHSLYDYHLHARYPSLRDTRKRVLYKIPVNILVMTPSVLVILFVFNGFHILGYQINMEDVKYAYLVGLGINIIFESLWEVIYIIEKVKESAAEKERIEQLQLHQEFDNLKQKVNPHFLFNSFNTLSSLIAEDKERAEKFLDELSKVYRYLLRSNESGKSTVEQEAKFIRSYARLLETRFGEGFHLEMSIDPQFEEKEIPSLTLQLLVENAVKHNVVSRQQPILVTIRSSPEGYLVVENNLNRKTRILQESTGIGLANIREKYKLLRRTDVSIVETREKFTVTVPILG